ncbi:MAG: GntR family transcriptional regulator, partial [Campylobacterota bacterium]|nr:GntR family transcriptional regulator [Campylobacterota bacterium]
MTKKMFDYEMVYSYILNLIETKLNENDKIPSEKYLCEKFDITRATARQGITKLKNEGLIYSKKGSGCFVSMQKIRYELSPFTTFTDQI